MLNEKRDVFIVDVLGWGFIDHADVNNFSPEAKMYHLREFIKSVVKQKVVVVGASLGGALAITLAAENPELVEKVVLIDAQGFIDGKGPSDIPDSLAKFGVNILKSWPLRMYANVIAYSDKKFATWDAMLIGRLHCFENSWERASVAFLKSGGFIVSKLVEQVTQPSLIIWGENDEILEPATASRFLETLPNKKSNILKWIKNCGHVPHLEKPKETAYAILSFIGDI